jgi:hypothetical protein
MKSKMIKREAFISAVHHVLGQEYESYQEHQPICNSPNFGSKAHHALSGVFSRHDATGAQDVLFQVEVLCDEAAESFDICLIEDVSSCGACRQDQPNSERADERPNVHRIPLRLGVEGGGAAI